jgi:hypothetical protein
MHAKICNHRSSPYPADANLVSRSPTSGIRDLSGESWPHSEPNGSFPMDVLATIISKSHRTTQCMLEMIRTEEHIRKPE